MAVILETSIGDITVDLYTDERPTCCRNFLKLCKMKYYNFSLFHSIQQNFIAQTGDPTGTGRGGESVFGKLFGEQAAFFEMELKPRIKHKKLGALSMVNNGNDMHGSQFFLTLGSELDYLDGLHTVFGEVSEGFDILTKLNETIVDEEKRPFKDVRILHTVVLDDPYDDPSGLAEYIPDKSPEPTKEILDSGRIGIAEKLDDYEGMAQEEVEELMKKKEAKANAQLLEMVGDLPEEDVAPPDTVLFVCKLNPVTSSEDLEIIFSRFGNILSCEVIKDQKSGESLQYAFVEFEKPEECENAYFKMDNVLIDERRIHVDFSQSVSKLKYQGKEKDEKGRDRPKFAIKDTAWKRKDGYEYVFDESEPASSGKKKNKKKKKHRQRSSSSESEEEPRRPAKKQKPRSPSPDIQRFKRKQDSVRYQQKRDRSPVPEKQRNRSSSRDKDRRKQRVLSPSPRRDRSRSRERKQRQRRRDSSSSPERQVRSRSREKGQKQRRQDPSSSPERQHQKRGREKKQKYRNRDSSSSPERQQSRRRDRSPEYSDRRRERSRSRDRERRDKYR